MYRIICDKCGQSGVVATSHVKPNTWSDVRVIANINDINAKYGGTKRQSLLRAFCPDCTQKMFDFAADAEPTLEVQFKTTMADYFNDLAINAVEAAQDIV